MIGYLLFFMIFASAVFSIITENVTSLCDAAVASGQNAVELCLSIAGAMAVWGGVMRVAEVSGLTEKLTKILSPMLSKIFRGIDKNSYTLQKIAMNVSANLLGLGNAATPLGISAMKSLAEEEKTNLATKNMTLLMVLNSCSVQIIPTTVAALRQAAGSRSPMEILPCVLIVSLCSLAIAMAAAEILYIGGRREN